MEDARVLSIRMMPDTEYLEEPLVSILDSAPTSPEAALVDLFMIAGRTLFADLDKEKRSAFFDDVVVMMGGWVEGEEPGD